MLVAFSGIAQATALPLAHSQHRPECVRGKRKAVWTGHSPGCPLELLGHYRCLGLPGVSGARLKLWRFSRRPKCLFCAASLENL